MPSPESGPRRAFNDLAPRSGHPPAERSAFRFSGPHAGATTLTFAQEVLAGLTATPKSLQPKHLYDARGSALFEEITRTPEYYLTRLEAEIMARHGDRLRLQLGAHLTVIELGAGAEAKALDLLQHLERPQAWLPIDVSVEHLGQAVHRFRDLMPEVAARANAGDFMRQIEIALPAETQRLLVFFPGSTLGNLKDGEALALLRAIRGALAPGDGILLGTDLVKDVAILQAAYDDEAGVTRRFIKNVLVRLHTELGVPLDPEDFDYQASWNEACSRMEMRLIARRDLSVSLDSMEDGAEIYFERGEAIFVEGSRKYTRTTLKRFAAETGFAIRDTLMDAREHYAINLWEAQ